MNPTVYLLCGLPGSGKTTYAKEIEDEDTVRFTLDEELFKKFGRDFPEEEYSENERKIKEDLKLLSEKAVDDGKSVILDYGFWKKAERDEYKKWAISIGATPKLLYFKGEEKELLNRVQHRNSENKETDHLIIEGMMKRFISQFEEPNNEDDVLIFNS